jgi:molybdopterin converting factor small subunit
MKLTVQYFAELAEVAGCSEEVIESTSSNLNEIYAQLQNRYGFRFAANSLKPVCNDALVGWNAQIKSGDVIAFLPPFSGG